MRFTTRTIIPNTRMHPASARIKGSVFGCATKTIIQVIAKIIIAVLKFSVNIKALKEDSPPAAITIRGALRP